MAASPGRALRRAKSSRDDLIHRAVSRVASQQVRVTVGARRPAMDYAEVSSGQVSPIMQLSPPGSPLLVPSDDNTGAAATDASAAAAAAPPMLSQGPAEDACSRLAASFPNSHSESHARPLTPPTPRRKKFGESPPPGTRKADAPRSVETKTRRLGDSSKVARSVTSTPVSSRSSSPTRGKVARAAAFLDNYDADEMQRLITSRAARWGMSPVASSRRLGRGKGSSPGVGAASASKVPLKSPGLRVTFSPDAVAAAPSAQRSSRSPQESHNPVLFRAFQRLMPCQPCAKPWFTLKYIFQRGHVSVPRAEELLDQLEMLEFVGGDVVCADFGGDEGDGEACAESGSGSGSGSAGSAQGALTPTSRFFLVAQGLAWLESGEPRLPEGGAAPVATRVKLQAGQCFGFAQAGRRMRVVADESCTTDNPLRLLVLQPSAFDRLVALASRSLLSTMRATIREHEKGLSRPTLEMQLQDLLFGFFETLFRKSRKASEKPSASGDTESPISGGSGASLGLSSDAREGQTAVTERRLRISPWKTLKKALLRAKLNLPEAQAFLGTLQMVTIADGDPVVCEGEHGGAFNVIVSGRANVSRSAAPAGGGDSAAPADGDSEDTHPDAVPPSPQRGATPPSPPPPGAPPRHLIAQLYEGQCFGELSLVTDLNDGDTATQMQATAIHAQGELVLLHVCPLELMQAGDDVACHAVARVLSAVASESEPVWRARFMRAAQVPSIGAPRRSGGVTLVLPAKKTVPNVISSPVRSRSTALIKRRSVNRKWQQQVAAAKRELELEVAPASRALAARFDEVASLSVDTGGQEQ